MAIILDPRWSREKLARVGRDLSFEWLTLNRLPLPRHAYFDRASANVAYADGELIKPTWIGAHRYAACGSWIVVDVAGCHMERRVRPTWMKPFWNAPGSFLDFTPFGVFCHEVGHHVDYILHPKAFSTKNGFSEVVDNEEEVSHIEHNVLESFAEAIRLFITNPDLLRQGRPDRYEFLSKGMGLKRMHDRSWRTVLQRAGKRIVSAAESWILQ